MSENSRAPGFAKQVRLVLGRGNQLEQHHAEREMAMHDLVIRGATVVDGLGHDPIRTDLAVRDRRISRLYRGRRRPTSAADLLHLKGIEQSTVGMASIGGAGTFDGIVLSGIVAVYLA
jgi:hypothetical protein